MKTILFALLLVLLFSSGCIQHRYTYTASKINTPFLQHKGDSRLNTSFSFGNAHGFGDSSINLGYDIQAAYAVTTHFGLMASTYFRKEADQLTNDIIFSRPLYLRSYVTYRRNLMELGAGYFTKTGSGTVFQVYGGGAFGSFSLADASARDSAITHNTYRANVTKYFIQPGFSFIDKKTVSADISVRLTMMRYQNTSTTYTNEDLLYFNLTNRASPKTRFFIEPSFCFQVPLHFVNWLSIETSGSAVFIYSSGPVRFWNLSLGITVDPVAAFRK